MKILEKEIHRLRSERGESISEALVAMLVVAMGAIMLVSMTIAATHVVERSEKAYAEYLDERNAVESMGNMTVKNSTESQSYAVTTAQGNVTLSSEDGRIRFTAAAKEENVTIRRVQDSSGKTKLVTYTAK